MVKVSLNRSVISILKENKLTIEITVFVKRVTSLLKDRDRQIFFFFKASHGRLTRDTTYIKGQRKVNNDKRT